MDYEGEILTVRVTSVIFSGQVNLGSKVAYQRLSNWFKSMNGTIKPDRIADPIKSYDNEGNADSKNVDFSH